MPASSIKVLVKLEDNTLLDVASSSNAPLTQVINNRTLHSFNSTWLAAADSFLGAVLDLMFYHMINRSALAQQLPLQC